MNGLTHQHWDFLSHLDLTDPPRKDHRPMLSNRATNIITVIVVCLLMVVAFMATDDLLSDALDPAQTQPTNPPLVITEEQTVTPEGVVLIPPATTWAVR